MGEFSCGVILKLLLKESYASKYKVMAVSGPVLFKTLSADLFVHHTHTLTHS